MPTSPSSVSFTRRLLFGNAVVVFFVVALTAFNLYQSRQAHVARTEIATRNLAGVLEQNIAAAIDKADMSLRSVAYEFGRQQARGGVLAEEMERFLAEHRALVPELASLRLVDANGIIRFGYTADDPKGRVDVTDRSYFIRARDNPDAGLVISEPVRSRITDKWVIILARRLDARDGSFAGVVFASIGTEYFQSLFAGTNLGQAGTITLRGEDLALIARYPATSAALAAMGTRKVTDEFRQALAVDAKAGTFVAMPPIDGVERTLSYARIADYPLYIVVGISNQETLSAWRKEAATATLLATLLIMATLVSSWLSYRAWIRQRQSDTALAKEVERQKRLKRSLELLSASNLALAQTRDSDRLLQEICRMIVDIGGYRLAWVGFPENDADKSVRRMAQYGEGSEFLARLRITWADEEHGRGMVGTALRTGKTQVVQNVLSHPSMSPWREAALSQGFRSGIALPLTAGQAVLGALIIYCDAPDVFVDEEIRLLEELAGNLAFGLEAGRTDARLAAERSFSQSLTDSFPGVFFAIDTERRLVRWNRTFEEVSGRSAAEMASLDPLELFLPEERDCIAACMSRTFDDGEARCEAGLLAADGQARPYFFSGRRVLLDGETLLVGVGMDVSSIKALEAELARHRDHLEDLVARRTEELTAARHAAEAANEAKSVFLANMSHEIRTPLNAIIGMTHLLQRSPAEPGQEEKLGKILEAARHLLSVINDILDISKIEAGKLHMEIDEFRIEPVILGTRALVADRAEAKNLELVTDIDPALNGVVAGDPLRLGQVLLNFASNAVKFTERGRISLRARCLAREGQSVLARFEVEDTGIGIAESAQERLFQAFEQADGSITRQYGGTGLGLAISRRLVELMGGEIGVDSRPGQGSTFWFTARLGSVDHSADVVPAEDAPAGDTAALIAARHTGARVLLVEDEPVNREIAAEFLSEAGLAVDMAENGAIAVDKASRERYDLILMDMQMPVMDGLTATRAIRTLPGHTATPIVAMTANAFAEDRARCLEAGMSDHLAKPFDPGIFLAALLRWLDATRARETYAPSPLAASSPLP